MKDNVDKISFSYEVDRNLLLLFEFISMLNAYISFPEKYSNLLSKIEFELDNEIFKRPTVENSIALITEKITLTDVYEKE